MINLKQKNNYQPDLIFVVEMGLMGEGQTYKYHEVFFDTINKLTNANVLKTYGYNIQLVPKIQYYTVPGTRKLPSLTRHKVVLLCEFYNSQGYPFMVTCHDRTALIDMNKFLPAKFGAFGKNYLKYGSNWEADNLRLEELATWPGNIVISTGNGGYTPINDVFGVGGSSITIMDCVSEYPPKHPPQLDKSFGYLKKTFPMCKLGWSDHYPIYANKDSTAVAYATKAMHLGARMFERHVWIGVTCSNDAPVCTTPTEFYWYVQQLIDEYRCLNGRG